MDRRSFLIHSAIAAGSLYLHGRPWQDAAPIVETTAGVLRGESAEEVNIFRGVPFAEPPVGSLRFRPPRPVEPWSGVRDATQFAAAAMQPEAEEVPQSEDCLYLNVWAPKDGGAGNRVSQDLVFDNPGSHPVFVWIHGGGFTGGHSFDPLFDGTGFAQAGIVCVTLAYRLGVFGFLNLEPLLGPAYAGSANNGMRDILLALRWLQSNVSAFGGDPRRVTVGGESAGAKLIDMIMGVPAATDLFHQMISESGGAERIWRRERAAEITTAFAPVWSESSGQAAAALKTAPAHEVIAAQQRFIPTFAGHFPLRAEVDGTLLPQFPLDTIRRGSTRGKRLLLGTNRDESALFIGPHPLVDPGPGDLGNLTVQQFRSIEERYRQLYPDMSDQLRRIRSLTAEEYWIPSMRVVDAHLQGRGGATFVYRFDFAVPEGRYAGLAFHASELPYVWDHMGEVVPSPAVAALAQTVHAAWCSFVRGEVPGAPGLPAWPPYSTSRRPTMLLNLSSHVEDAPQKAEFAAWSGLLTQ